MLKAAPRSSSGSTSGSFAPERFAPRLRMAINGRQVMRLIRGFLRAAACGAVPLAAQQKIPVRQVGPAEAVATTKVDARSLVRPLSDGRVIVSRGKAVGIFSADLATYKNIAD